MQQVEKKMEDQKHQEENNSLVLQAIKIEQRKFWKENKQDLQSLKEEINEDMKTELKEIKSEIYQSISANIEKINTLENRLMMEAEAWVA